MNYFKNITWRIKFSLTFVNQLTPTASQASATFIEAS